MCCVPMFSDHMKFACRYVRPMYLGIQYYREPIPLKEKMYELFSCNILLSYNHEELSFSRCRAYHLLNLTMVTIMTDLTLGIFLSFFS